MVAVVWGVVMKKVKAVLAQASPEPLCFYIFIIYALPSSNMEYEVVYITTLCGYNDSVINTKLRRKEPES